ncbi:MAG: hypothetical protein HY540_01760 [Deltaproteobacteria bacterium]|nr:hypothetical protein [Deltaproteobacteria bacterium]
MPHLDDEEVEFEEEIEEEEEVEIESCPNCGNFVGTSSVCDNCGAVLGDDNGFDDVLDDDDADDA